MLLADESVNENLIISLEPLRIIVTEDKDFGEIVYHQNLTVAGVILLRYSPLDYNIIEIKLLNSLSAHLKKSIGKFVVINSRLTRVRYLPS